MEERKRGYQGRRLAGATPRQEPERRGSRTRQAEDKARRERDPWEMTPEEKVSPVEATSAEEAQAEPQEQSVRQVEDKARRERDPWEMTSEEPAPITPGDGEPVSAGRRAEVTSAAADKTAPTKNPDNGIGSADGTSADHAAGAAGPDDAAGLDGGSGSGGAAVKKKKSGFAAFWSDFGYLIVTAVVVVLVFRVLLQLSWVPSGSMETTIPKKTLLISWQLPYVMGDPVPERGNIVTFWSDELDKLLVKRVIGLPGDTVSFSGGYVYINGQRLEEDYLDQQGGTISPNQTSFTVPEGCLFFLGDNRSGSNDARYWEESYIPVGNVKAHVLLAISLTGGSSWQGVRAIG